MLCNWRKWSMFLPRATALVLQRTCGFPPEIAQIVVAYSKDELLSGFDPYGYWTTPAPIEYGHDGSYGHLPSVDTGLPLFV